MRHEKETIDEHHEEDDDGKGAREPSQRCLVETERVRERATRIVLTK